MRRPRILPELDYHSLQTPTTPVYAWKSRPMA
jgi:hypothetical protein